MNVLENLIAVFSPQRAYARQVWRQALAEQRGYDAASTGRLNSAWRVANESAEATDRVSRDIIRARARDLENNSDIMLAGLSAYKRNVVGYGFTLQAQTPEPETNAALEALWNQWCKAAHCDVTGEQSLVQLCRMALVRKRVDGGILIRKCYSGDWLVPLQLQALEVDELDVSQVAPHQRGHKVVGGVEYDAYKRPVGYWIKQYALDGWELSEPEWVPAEQIIFLHSKKRPSQIREISDMAATVTRIRDVNEYITAISVKERLAACVGLVVKKALPQGGFGRDASAQNDQRADYSGKKMTPGMIIQTNAGDDVTVVDPQQAASDATTFAKLQLSLIAAGQGLSYESLSRDLMGSTYSSARQGAIEDELTYIEEKELLMELYSNVYEEFVRAAVLAGAVTIPQLWREPEPWLRHTWTERPKPWVDPEKEANANATAMSTGQKTFQTICAEQGNSWKAVIDDMAEAMAYAEEKGVDLNAILFGSAGNTGAAAEPEPSEPGSAGTDPGDGQ